MADEKTSQNEKPNEETTSENNAETTAQNNGLSPEAIAEMQARIDALTAEALKFKTKADQQEGRAKKAESMLKAEKGEVSTQLDELRQKNEISEAKLQEREAKIELLTSSQRMNAAMNAVLTSPIKLHDGARPMLTKLIMAETGVYEGRTVVLTEAGTPRISAKTGKEMTIDEARDEILEKSPFLCESGVVSGQGTGNNTAGVTGLKQLQELERMDAGDRAAYMSALSPEQRKAIYAQGR